MRKLSLLAAASALALAGCQTTDPYTGQQKTSNATWGAVIGALGGAAAGALTNTSHGNKAAQNAMIGAGIGALAGGAVGSYMDRQEAQLRAKLAGTGVSVTRAGDRIILNMPSDITFDLNRADVKSDFYPVLGSVKEVIKEFNKTVVNIDGYTDTLGAPDYNITLSQQRANNVGSYLMNQGVMAQRLIVVGHGETGLKVATGDNVNEPRNRRVEIQLSPLTTS
jgi:outer membrane protein OmpA-like peptidoglycan-associated protein